MANITYDAKKYDPKRLVSAQRTLQEIDSGVTASAPEDVHVSVISMRDAIEIADNEQSSYRQRENLSDTQKFLISIVAQERKTKSGRFLTNSAASRDEWIGANSNIDVSARHYNHGGITAINPRLTVNFYRTLHHELTHSLQEVTAPMPEGLSIFDRKLWELGAEGQAFVAEADEAARREGRTLTNEEKRRIFTSMEGSLEHYLRKDFDNITRTDGRKLTMQEYDKAFGFIPGYEKEGSFLKDGNYKDPANIIQGSQIFYALRREAERKLLKYDELPVPAAGSDKVRFDSTDKKYVVIVDPRDGDKVHIQVYKQKFLTFPLDGSYVMADERDVKAEKLSGGQKSYNYDFFKGSGKKFGSLFLTIAIGNGEITLKALNSTDDDIKAYPFERHQPEPAPTKEDSISLPDSAKSAALEAGNQARACNLTMDGEAASIKKNIYIRNITVSESVRGREG